MHAGFQESTRSYLRQAFHDDVDRHLRFPPVYRSKGGYVQTHQYRQNNVFHVVIRLAVVVERLLPLTTAYPSLEDSF